MDMTLRIAEFTSLPNEDQHEKLYIALRVAELAASLDVAEARLRENLSADEFFVYRGGSHLAIHLRSDMNTRVAMIAEQAREYQPSVDNFAALKLAVAKARTEAEREAKGYGYRIVRSRGTFIATVDAQGNQANPYPGAEACTWDGTKKDLQAAIALVEAKYPEVAEIVIEGGFIGGNTFDDFRDGDYQPWASAWSVTVWTRQ